MKPGNEINTTKDAATHAHPRRRFPFGLVWLVLTVIILILVIVYDRRGIKSAQEHVESGKDLASRGLYVEALEEYEEAFNNRRLGRKGKAEVAVAMAEIYYNQLDDYPAAHRYYTQARQNYLSSMEGTNLEEHSKVAALRARQTGTFELPVRTSAAEGITTRTVVQRVEILQEPLADLRGPVVATYEGGEVHAGELLRALSKRPEFNQPDFREDPERLRAFLDNLVKQDMAYQAAIAAGIHKDTDISERLYDYQKSLIAQRFQIDRRDQAQVVDNKAVETYYHEHIGDYVQPGRISVQTIASDTEVAAKDLLTRLENGERFEDLASSNSVHTESAKNRGSLGDLTEETKTLPGIGDHPEIVKALFSLPLYSVTEVTPLGGKFYLFRVSGIVPAKNVSLDEARPRIENLLRGSAIDKARAGFEGQLKETFTPVIDDANLSKFWTFALSESQAVTTATASPTTPTVSSATQTTGTANP